MRYNNLGSIQQCGLDLLSDNGQYLISQIINKPVNNLNQMNEPTLNLLTNEYSQLKKSIASNNREAIEKQLALIKNITQPFLNQAIIFCIQSYKVEEPTDQSLHILLRQTKANPNYQHKKETPLIAAIKKGQLSLVRRLIENGAKPDQLNSQGKHPIQFLLNQRQQNHDIAEYLLSHMQSVNIKIGQLNSLHIAVQNQFTRIAKILIDKNSDLYFQNQSIMHIIMKKKFKNTKKKKKILKQFISRPALWSFKDNFGKIPIQYEQSEQIKAYYLQNFKTKQKVQSLANISNNSSIIMSQKQKPAKARNISLSKDKEIQKKKKDNKQFKQCKQLKEEQNSFQEDIEQQEDNFVCGNKQLNWEKTENSKLGKKINVKHNVSVGSFMSTSTKFKSKYSNIPSKTQSNLKKKALQSSKHQKKVNSSFIIYPTKKKNQKYQQEKKETKRKNNDIEKSQKAKETLKKVLSSQQIVVQTKTVFIESSQRSNRILSNNSIKANQQVNVCQKNKDKKDSQQITLCQELRNFQLLKQEEKQNSHESIKIGKQFTVILPKINNLDDQNQNKETEDTQNMIQEGQQKIQLTKEQQILNKMDLVMGDLIIKDDQQTTNLKQLRNRFAQILQNFKIDSLSNQKIQTLLANQIIITAEKINKCSQQANKYIKQIIPFLRQKIYESLQSRRKEKVQVNIEIYGSRANGLQIQNSDLDLLVNVNIESTVKELINELEKFHAFDCNQINQSKFIVATSMPVIKLGLNNSYGLFNVDLTFQIRGHTGVRCTNLIKQFIEAQPLLKPLVLSLKTLINAYSLCDTYTGGLGSYSLTLMTIALLQFTDIQKKKQNLGELILQFFLFYGFQLDYVCQAVIIHPPGFSQKPVFSIYQLPYSLDLSPKLIIYDPLNPVNNVGRATYRIVSLKKLLKICYVKLKTGQTQSLGELQKISSNYLQI